MDGNHSEPSSSAPNHHTLRDYLRPHRASLAQAFVLLLLTNGLDKTIPVFLKHAVDALVGGKFSAVAMSALLVAVLALGMGLVRTLSRVRAFNVGRDVEYQLRSDLLAHLHRLGPSFFRRMPTGETMSRAINDLSQVRAMVGFGSLNMVNS